jgi:hypothetical protein
MNISILKKPTALLPLAVSFAALGVVLVHIIRSTTPNSKSSTPPAFP